MFITAVCLLFLLKLKWPKNKSVYDLATLTSRFCETYGCVPAQQNTVADLSYLCNRVAFLRSHFVIVTTIVL